MLALPLQRLIARAIDLVVVVIVTVLVVMTVMLLFRAAGTCGPCPFLPDDPPQSQTAPPTDDDGDAPAQSVPPTVLEQVLVLAGMTLYDVLGMRAGRTGSSIGRQLMRIRAVDAHIGGPLGWGALVNRWAILGTGFAVIIAMESLHPAWYVYALGAASGAGMFFNPTRQAWHDVAAASVVVRDPEPRPPADSASAGPLWTPDTGPTATERT